MNIRDSAYTNSDAEYQEVCDFLDRLALEDPCALWESGRMGFWRHSLHAAEDPRGAFFADNAHLWRDEDEGIVALCISEYGRNDLFIELSPAWREVTPDVLRWIEQEWAAERTDVEVLVFSEDCAKIGCLEESGFRFLRHCENKRSYDLEIAPLAYELENGFAIRTFAEHPDATGRVELTRNVFENPDYSEARLQGLMSSPDYRGEYHLMVVTPSRQPVAYCIGWHERTLEGHGYIEPVGTHSEYRRRGFARAVIRECFARMKRNGIHTVEIGSAAEPAVSNVLYQSLVPSCRREVHKYRKTLTGA